jgi:hypothetical protein
LAVFRSPDHPITRDHPIIDATKIPAEESQIVQSGQPVAGLLWIVRLVHVRAHATALITKALAEDYTTAEMPSVGL